MTEQRWLAEIKFVQENFPEFAPFVTQSGVVGFAGTLKGRRRVYQVVIKVAASSYPAIEPQTYMDPKPEQHHWIPQDSTPIDKRHLCYKRDGGMWNPAKSSFANCILIAVRYIHAFD